MNCRIVLIMMLLSLLPDAAFAPDGYTRDRALRRVERVRKDGHRHAAPAMGVNLMLHVAGQRKIDSRDGHPVERQGRSHPPGEGGG
jgi:hypothetical protein